MRTMAALFADRPSQWGLRGDPYLWDAFHTALADRPIPGSAAELQQLLEETFEKLTGSALAQCENVRVESFPKGGMSGGVVSGAFWRDKGFPLIQQRYLADFT